MVPPPAPSVRTLSIGVPISWPAIAPSVVSGMRPSTMTLMSVLVPPMSKVTTWRRAGQPGQRRAGDDARGRAGQQRLVGMARADRKPHQPAVRLHQEELRRRHPGRVQPFFEPHQIAADPRSDIGVDHGGGKPRILADHRQHRRRQRDAASWRLGGDDARRAALVIGIEEREEEAHRDRLDALVRQTPHRAGERRLVERRQDFAAVIEPLGHLLGQMLRHQQRRLLGRKCRAGRCPWAATSRALRRRRESRG